MGTERWQLLERLYHGALELEPGRRGPYLRGACGSDESLRREVEGLLAREEQSQTFLEEPALEIAARDLAANPVRLSSGQIVGRYRILGQIGAGGMGIVYSAHDSRLGRTVALKFLPDEFAGDRDALDRFQREFHALSAFNHPNICTIYDAGEADGRTFISMEYVKGKTLDQRTGRKGLPLQEALNYAVQIAGALAKAHAEGIIHRDLKPANIMVSDEGHVKLLDFGLAKLTERARPEHAAFGLGPDQAPTVEGTIVGTAAYMSPEQATGKKLDGRSDIFSFGAVLYEMITGQRCFRGENDIATLSAVLNTEPEPVSHAARATPRELERIVARCIRKDPERRFQSAADLKVALREVQEEPDAGKSAPPAPESRRPSAMAMAAAGILLTAIPAVLWLTRSNATPGRVHNLVMTRLTADSGLTTSPGISSDGKFVAFSSDRGGDDNLDIWVQQVAGGPPNRITNNPADDTLPEFSPDGSKIAFVSTREGGGIYIVSTLGGGERRVAKTGPHTSRPRFSPDGRSILYSVGTGKCTARLYVVSATAGASMPLRLSTPWAADPVWSPDGEHILFVGSSDASGFGVFDWWLASAAGGEAVKSGALEAFARAGLKPPAASYTISPASWTGDRITFVARVGDSTDLWQTPISSKTWQIHEAPERLTTGAEQELGASVSPDGLIAFATVDERLNLWMLAADTNKGKVTGSPQPVTQACANCGRPSLSADGRKLAFQSDRSGNVDIWLREMDSGKERPLTATPWDESHPSISADGSRVLFASQEDTKTVIHLVNLATGVTERLCDDCGMPMGWSPDGTRVIFYYRTAMPYPYGWIDIHTKQRAELIRHPQHNLHMVRFFPEGGWLGFHVPILQNEPVSPIFIAPVRNGAAAGTGEWIQVTDGSGIEATPWSSPDGSIVYFLSKREGFQCIWAQHLDRTTKQPKGTPFEVAHFHGARRKLREEDFGPGVSADKLVFTMGDSTGNIWVTKIEPSK